MNQYIQFVKRYATMCVVIVITFSFLGCKKTNPGFETMVSFTYNGQQHSIASSGVIQTQLILPELIFANFEGLQIDRPDLFGGTIKIHSSNTGGINCAFLNPTGMNVLGLACNALSNNGGVIDSVAVYWLESGNLTVSYSQCKDAEGTSVPGQKDCLVSGNFSLTLVNKNNQRIILTDGSFYGPMRKYL